MKQEEMNDISTILVEATDERAEVIKQLSKQNKPVVIVLSEQADQVFKQPGDFFELKRLKRERGLSITLVISGHERIRNMARRQGFQVYTSAETCARALARRDRLYTMRGISLPGTASLTDQAQIIAQGDEDDTPPWSYEVHMQEEAFTAETPESTQMQSQEQSGDDTPWSYDVQMAQDETPTAAHPVPMKWTLTDEELWNQKHNLASLYNQRIPPAHLERAPLVGARNQADPHSVSLKETPIPPSFTETLENLVAISGEKLSNASAMQHISPVSDINVNAPYASIHRFSTYDTRSITGLSDEAPTQPIAIVKARSRHYAPDTEPLHPVIETRPLTHSEYVGSRLALMLTALLILGILGGVCCGYILTLMHVNLTVLSTTISSL
jgi:hypothetical protein